MFYEVLHKRNLLPARREMSGRKDEIDDVISRLQPEEFLEVVDEVQRVAFTRTIWVDDDNDDTDIDF